jgi:hypothetical protein
MRKWLIGLFALFLVLVAALLGLVGPRSSKVTRAAFDRIEVGMTRAEAEAILGGPPGDYRTRPGGPAFEGSGGGISWDMWCGDEGEIWLACEGGRVRTTRFEENEPHPISLIEVAVWRLERLKSRWLR